LACDVSNSSKILKGLFQNISTSRAGSGLIILVFGSGDPFSEIAPLKIVKDPKH
jgi:hypothetical protein